MKIRAEPRASASSRIYHYPVFEYNQRRWLTERSPLEACAHHQHYLLHPRLRRTRARLRGNHSIAMQGLSLICCYEDWGLFRPKWLKFKCFSLSPVLRRRIFTNSENSSFKTYVDRGGAWLYFLSFTLKLFGGNFKFFSIVVLKITTTAFFCYIYKGTTKWCFGFKSVEQLESCIRVDFYSETIDELPTKVALATFACFIFTLNIKLYTNSTYIVIH